MRLLGRACQQKGISSLLFAHHEGDVVETSIMRLTKQSSMAGLVVLKSAVRMPECNGMYGVSQSTLVSSFSDESQVCPSAKVKVNSGAFNAKRHGSITIPLPAESGGIHVYRPLLPFSKARLQATCQSLGIEWVEDETNSDPTFTARNAIRALLQGDRLPVAFRVPSMLAHVERAKELHRKNSDWSNWIWSECKILKLDTRTGTLVFQLPSQKSFYDPKSVMCLDIAKAVYLLRRILRLVAPHSRIPGRRLIGSAEIMFPHLSNEDFHDNDRDEPSTERKPGLSTVSTFTVAGAQVTNLNTSEFPPTYIIQRRLFAQSQYPKPIAIAPSHGREDEMDIAYRTRLWDNRFWLRVKNLTSQVLYIAPLTQSRAKDFRLSLCSDPVNGPGESARLKRVMKGLVLPTAQWIIPAIIKPTNATAIAQEMASDYRVENETSAAVVSNDYKPKLRTDASLEHLVPDPKSFATLSDIEALGEVVALPSLGFVHPAWKDKVSWDCKYKEVDLGFREVEILESGLQSTTLERSSDFEARLNTDVQGTPKVDPSPKEHLLAPK